MAWLETPEAQQQLRVNCRVADLEVWPSTMNILEAVRNGTPHVRGRLLRTLVRLLQGRAPLPWPIEVVRRAGLGIIHGARTIDMGEHGLNWILADPDNVSDSHVKAVREELEERESAYARMHEAARKRLQPRLRQLQKTDWLGLAGFLDQHWMRPDLLAPLIQEAWEGLELEGQAPLAEVLLDDAWRLYFEGFGAAVFERGVSREQPKRVQEADLLQLIYMGGAARRIFVTNDKALHRVGSAVLHGRHRLARVLWPAEMLE